MVHRVRSRARFLPNLSLPGKERMRIKRRSPLLKYLQPLTLQLRRNLHINQRESRVRRRERRRRRRMEKRKRSLRILVNIAIRMLVYNGF